MNPIASSPSTTRSVTVAGSGGSGALTTGNLLLDASAREGLYGILTRTVGPQIRGGEAAAMLHLGTEPVECISDCYDLFLAMDWKNIERYATEIPLKPESLIIADPAQGEVPAIVARSGAKVIEIPIKQLAAAIKGRPNMIALGIMAELLGLSAEAIQRVLQKRLGEKGKESVAESLAAIEAGRTAVRGVATLSMPGRVNPDKGRWVITGNEATGLGAIRGGIRFVAAYPITPATEILEWLSSTLSKVGGTLVQAEDELASANMVIGASYGGVPSLTATSGPGLVLMMESLGLAVSAEVPLVVIDVMRGGPSTGMPTKSEQSDLNIALYGFHGDAPHLVLAPTSIADSLFTSQWAVFLAEAMQVPAIVLSDQFMGQARMIIDPPLTETMAAKRDVAHIPGVDYRRYADTPSGISPMSVPGISGGQYTADGLEHSQSGLPSTTPSDHAMQLDKRLRKLTGFDYGDHWAEISGRGAHAIITWGSTTGAVREALKRLHHEEIDDVRLIAIRLLSPTQPERLVAALAGVDRVLVVEQTHSGQFYRYLRAHYELPGDVQAYHRPGPQLIHPGELYEKIKNWRIV